MQLHRLIHILEPSSVRTFCLEQAVGELRTVDGRTAAKSSRPVLPKPRSAITKLARSIATAPLAAVGLWHDYMKMQVGQHAG